MKSSERGAPPFTLVLPEDLEEPTPPASRPRELSWVPRRRRREPPAREPTRED